MANNNLKAYLNIMSNGESDRLNNVNNNAYNDYSLTESLAISRYNALNRKRNLSTNALINLNN